MGSFSDYLENKVLDHVLATTPFTAPTHTWVALTTHVLADDDTGSSLLELAGGQYSRRICDSWDAASGGATANTDDLTFAQATDDWGKIVDFAIVDTGTLNAGNMLAYGSLTISKSVASGDTPKFAAGDLDITLN